MALTIVDARPAAYQGNLSLATLTSIIDNSRFNTSYGAWSTANATVTITRGAHEGSFYPDYNTNYYFDVTVSVQPGTFHSLLNNPSDANSSVLANV